MQCGAKETVKSIGKSSLRFGALHAALVHANRGLRTCTLIYRFHTIASTGMSLGSRRKLTASIDSVNTSLTFANPRSFT